MQSLSWQDFCYCAGLGVSLGIALGMTANFLMFFVSRFRSAIVAATRIGDL